MTMPGEGSLEWSRVVGVLTSLCDVDMTVLALLKFAAIDVELKLYFEKFGKPYRVGNQALYVIGETDPVGAAFLKEDCKRFFIYKVYGDSIRQYSKGVDAYVMDSSVKFMENLLGRTLRLNSLETLDETM